MIVAENEGKVAGFACSYGESDPEWGALLDNLHVDPDQHRHGIGRQLVIETMKWSAISYPGRGLFLWVLEKNARAQAFYESIRAPGRIPRSRRSRAAGRLSGCVTCGQRSWWPKLPQIVRKSLTINRRRGPF